MSLSLPEFASQLQRLTYQLTRDYETCDRFCLEQSGVTASQAYTLLALPIHESVNMNDLSEKMGLANSTMTRMVDQLVQKKLVERENDLGDRRVVRVRLSGNGFELRQTIETTLQSFFERIAKDIPVEERQEIIHSFQTINAAVLNIIRACC
jgi:DNA-binding MarR family transcriptional regulator